MRSMSSAAYFAALCLGLASAVLSFVLGCLPAGHVQPAEGEALSENDFFKDGTSARQIPPHTVARGDARSDSSIFHWPNEWRFGRAVADAS